jgi:hypothetical protein
VNNPQHDQAAYSIGDVRLSLASRDSDWQIDLFVNNVTDERAEIYQDTGNFEWAFSHSTEYERYHRTYTNRPREYGVRFYKGWGD